MQFYYDALISLSFSDARRLAEKYHAEGKSVMLITDDNVCADVDVSTLQSVTLQYRSTITSIHSFDGIVTVELLTDFGMLRVSGDASLSHLPGTELCAKQYTEVPDCEPPSPARVSAPTTVSGVEAERRFLISSPDIGALESAFPVTVWEIVQIYLVSNSPDIRSRRVRRIIEHGTGERKVSYLYTEKSPLPGATFASIESESEITEEDYKRLLSERDTSRCPISKTRYKLPCVSGTVELDVYPFCKAYAIAEVELEDENEHPELPEQLTVVTEVTENKALSNHALSKPEGYLALCTFARE